MATSPKASQAHTSDAGTTAEHKSPRPPEPANEPRREARAARARAREIPQHLFTVGFYTALVIALLCLGMGARYLYKFMESANAGVEHLLESAARAQGIPGAQAVPQGQSEPVAQEATEGRDTQTEAAKAKLTPQGAAEPQRRADTQGPKELSPDYMEVLINGRLVMARLAPLSCGVSVAFAFGFLGFALFLLGIKGSIDAEVEADAYKANFIRLPPGLLLLLASMILIGICVTHPTPFEYSTAETFEGGGAAPSESRRAPQGAPADGDEPKEQLPPRVK